MAQIGEIPLIQQREQTEFVIFVIDVFKKLFSSAKLLKYFFTIFYQLCLLITKAKNMFENALKRFLCEKSAIFEFFWR